jgi:MauM/NapG family ferredoxin protein
MPITAEEKERRKKVRQQWTMLRRVRQAVQFMLLAVFLYLVYTTTKKGVEALPVNLFSRFDPLMAVMGMVGSKSLIANMIPGLIMIVVTLLLGRVWCGWICPLGTVLDLYGPNVTDKIPAWFRQIKYVLLFAFIIAALFGTLALMWLDPITIFVRALSGTVFPAILQKTAPIETALKLDTARQATVVVRPVIYPLLALPLVIVLALNLFAKRFWCRYLCPLGAIVAFFSRFSFTKRFVDDSCVKCKACAKACPMNTISFEDFTSDPGECLQCLTCFSKCPTASIRLKTGLTSGLGYQYDPSRRTALASLVAGVAGGALFRSDAVKSKYAHQIRPPGAVEDDFLTKCIRCGQCIKVCPNNALHLALLEAGVESIWSPLLVPRIGNCDYDCNACGQVCPTQAIPKLSLEEKRQAKIGTAACNFDTCIRCLLCIPACPVEGAVVQKTVGERRGKYPVVDPTKCIGCGVCEFVCPVVGEDAIRVYAADAVPDFK